MMAAVSRWRLFHDGGSFMMAAVSRWRLFQDGSKNKHFIFPLRLTLAASL